MVSEDLFNDHKELITVLPFILHRVDELESTHKAGFADNASELNNDINSGDFRRNFYSLGILFYEQLTGQTPKITEKKTLDFDFSNHPYIPLSVSFIIKKLTYSRLNDRYQSYQGLRDDLSRCLSELQNIGNISCFFPGLTDKPQELNFSHYLYGREAETNQISEIVSTSVINCRSVLMVSGYSGVGKTSLIQQAISKFIPENAFFIQGKFDQTLNQPYAAFIMAVKELISQIKQKGNEELSMWKKILNDDLFPNGQALINIIPELELLLGSQPPVLELDTEQTKNRFKTVFQQFFNAFVKNDKPLIVFLDDLQWVDVASLDLLQVLIEQISHKLLIVGAYRDNECGPNHHLSIFMTQLQASSMQQIKLKSLSQSQTEQQIAALIYEISLEGLSSIDIKNQIQDMFKSNSKQAAALAELIFSKTHGNPFFTKQLIQSLKNQEFILFDKQLKQWSWDLTKLQEQTVSDNVGDFMAKQFCLLPEETQNLLLYAACLGHVFALKELALIVKKDELNLELSLWIAVNRGLIALIETDQNEKYYKFLHDRIQQAAYQSVSKSDSQNCHLSIAKSLEKHSHDSSSKQFLKIVDHYNIALPIVSNEDLMPILTMTIQAIQVAKNAIAYDLAYFYANQSLIMSQRISVADSVHTEIHIELAHCGYLTGQFEQAEAEYKNLLNKELPLSVKVDCYCKLSVLYMHTGRPGNAINMLRPALALAGIKMPTKITAFYNRCLLYIFRYEFWKYTRKKAIPISKKKLETLSSFYKIHSYFSTPAYMFDKNIHIYQKFVMTIFNIKASGTPVFTAIISHMISIEKNLDMAQKLHKRCLQANESREDPTSKDYFGRGGYISPYFLPIKEALLDLEASALRARNHGEIMFWSFSVAKNIIYSYISGMPLINFLDFYEKNIIILEYNKEQISYHALKEYPFVARKLVSGTKIEEEEITKIISSLSTAFFQIGLYVFYLSLVQYYLLFDDIKSAQLYSDKIEILPNGSLGMWHTEEHLFTRALVGYIGLENKPMIQKLKGSMRYQKDLAWLKKLAALNPANFKHSYNFLMAEKSRVFERKNKAQFYYDIVIQTAIENGFNQYAAIAAERASKYCLKNNDVVKSQHYLKIALEYYKKWGAKAKVMQCEMAVSELS